MRTLRRIVLSLIVLIVLTGLAAGATAYMGQRRWGDALWYFQSGPDYRLACGEKALQDNNEDRANEIALLLEAEGHKDHAALLRGETLLHHGKPYAEMDDFAVARPLLYKAIGQFNKITAMGQLRLRAAAVSGECLLFLHEPYQAGNAFNYVLSQDPDNILAHQGLAGVYYDQGAMSRAVMHADKWAELDPSDGRPDRLAAQIYKDQENFRTAIVYYERALTKKLPAGMPLQNPVHLRVELAECLVKRSLYERALEVLQDIDPPPTDAATVEALRAEALIRLNRVREGLDVLEKALSLYPSNVELLRLRAELHVQDKQYENALTLLERALLIDRYDYACRNAFIDVLRILGRKEEIKKQQALLDEILSDIKERTRLTQEAMSKPWDAAARRKLAELWRKFGREDMVQLWLKAAAACPPPSLFEGGDKADANGQTTPTGPSDKAAK
jgi:tetratricopeptide (TPR) repeat protein